MRHEFDVKLENVRGELRATEERLASVRSATLSAIEKGQAALNERRLSAADALWRAFIRTKRATLVAQMWVIVDQEKIAARRDDPGIQAFLKMLQKMADDFVAGLKPEDNAEPARPYVTPMAWALYTAYSGIVVDAVMTVKAIGFGVPLDVLKKDYVADLVKEALPDAGTILRERGKAAWPFLLRELEDRLLAELRASTEGRDSDPESAMRARRVADLLAEHEVARAKEQAGG